MRRRSHRILGLASVASAVIGCTDLTVPPVPTRPTVILERPVNGQQINFGTPIVIRAQVLAPAGGALQRAELVLFGADQDRRIIDLSGPEASLRAEVTVLGEGQPGPDERPLELRLIVTARVGDRTVESLPVGTSILLIDRTRPRLEIGYSPGIAAPSGFDAAFPAGAPFSLNLKATDAVSGISQVQVQGPLLLGDRSRTFSPVDVAELSFGYSPPLNGDLVFQVTARDAARTPNETARTIKIRVGDGGIDQAPPVVTATVTGAPECGGMVSVRAEASDPDSGVARIQLRSDPLLVERAGPAPQDPSRLSLTATVSITAGVGALQTVSISAEDLAGNVDGPRQLNLQVVDTQAPILSRAEPLDALRPRFPYSILLEGEDLCGPLDRAELRVDGRLVVAPLAGPNVQGPVVFNAPDVCALEPLWAEVQLVDPQGQRSAPTGFWVQPEDQVPPELTLLASPGAIAPGETWSAQVQIRDGQSPIERATVTILPRGMALPSPLFSDTSSWPAGDCTQLQDRAIPLELTLPQAIRFTSGVASLRVITTAHDAQGNMQTSTVDVPVRAQNGPSLSFLAPDDDVLLGGQTTPVVVNASDPHHDVQRVTLSVSGPAFINRAGDTSATINVNAASATVSFSLLVDPSAPAGAAVQLLAEASNSAAPAQLGQRSRDMEICGAPSITSITPSLGPANGDLRVELVGAGLFSGTELQIGGQSLTELQVFGSTVAQARLPASGSGYPRGPADVVATNVCGANLFGVVLQDGFRIVAPPTIELLRPSSGQTATPGTALSVSVGAAADGIPLAEISASLEGEQSTRVSVNAETGALDTSLLSSAQTATVVAIATDSLGQSSVVRRALQRGPATATQLSIALRRNVLALTETVGVQVFATMSDGTVRDVTPVAQLSASAGLTLAGSSVTADAEGTATLSAQAMGQSANAVVQVLAQGLVFAHPPMLLSPLLSPGSPGSAPVLWGIDQGVVQDVSGAVQLSLSATAAAALSGGGLEGRFEGRADLRATWQVGGSTLSATLPIFVQERLDVALGQRRALPSGQRFTGGDLQGEVLAYAPPGAGPWQVEILPGGRLTLAGRLLSDGAGGAPRGDGGNAGPGGGGGGAGLSPAGAQGGAGQPPGLSTVDNQPSTPAGAGGRGGEGAPAPGTSGAGGGSGGAGGAGLGTAGGLAGLPGGGGGGRAGGGGGAGAQLYLRMPLADLVLSGLLSARGGSGGPGAGGGGGGHVVLEVGSVLGRGRIVATGGSGGAGLSGAASGGGGGGGRVELLAPLSSPFLLLEADGGPGPQAGLFGVILR